MGSSVGDTVMVGVKLDSQSRELLTWALVKVAKPGDTVVALHVIGKNYIVDRQGRSCFLSLVEDFDSIMAVYEGFCNLKQVNLKLKICRGSSVREILVREAKSCSAATLIIGALSCNHKLKPSTSMAKYCSKKLLKSCSVLAVMNGKILFPNGNSQVSLEQKKIGSFSALQRSATITSNGRGSSGSETNKLTCAARFEQSAGDSYPTVAKTAIHGWPLMQRGEPLKISVVPWPMKLPSRQFSRSDCHLLPPIVFFPECLPEEVRTLRERCSLSCRFFTYQELIKVTNGFSKENLIGRGGCSLVYKGTLQNGSEIAVKKLEKSDQTMKEILLEIEIITSLQHKNIVSLKGICFADGKLFLVYDLLRRGSLEENLHGAKRSESKFGWKERFRTALGVAEALKYLHCDAAKPVIHRDVKSSNILLSDEFEPQLCDFGFATWASSSSSHVIFPDVVGTFGYLAPEYFMYGKVNDKTDIYAFGVVLLELLSGRKPISNDLPKGQESLVLWAKPILENGKVYPLVDPKLGSKHDLDLAQRMFLAASLCTKRSPKARPAMATVVRLLEGDGEATKWARRQLHVEDCDSSEEGSPRSSLQSHLQLAMLDVDDDLQSTGSVEQNVEDYLNARWSRSSSFE